MRQLVVYGLFFMPFDEIKIFGRIIISSSVYANVRSIWSQIFRIIIIQTNDVNQRIFQKFQSGRGDKENMLYLRWIWKYNS